MSFSAPMNWVNCYFKADTGKEDDVVRVAAPSCIQRLWIGQNLGDLNRLNLDNREKLSSMVVVVGSENS